MLAIPKGRGKVPHGHGGDIFCNEKKKSDESRQCSVNNAPVHVLLIVRAAKKRARGDRGKARKSVGGGSWSRGASAPVPILPPPVCINHFIFKLELKIESMFKLELQLQLQLKLKFKFKFELKLLNSDLSLG